LHDYIKVQLDRSKQACSFWAESRHI